MIKRLEAHMIEPIRLLMRESMGLGVVAEEFSSGYGVADLVGGAICQKSWHHRSVSGFTNPLDYEHLVEVLLLLKPGIRRSLNYLSNRVSFSDNLLRKKVLPRMEANGLVTFDADGFVHLLADLPQPTKHIVAVEAKQTRWHDAILQARRYTFFADQTYVAVWIWAADRVDRKLLYRHRLGLIGVGPEGAEVLLEAPKRNPRQPRMNRYCSEFLYRKALDEQGN